LTTTHEGHNVPVGSFYTEDGDGDGPGGLFSLLAGLRIDIGRQADAIDGQTRAMQLLRRQIAFMPAMATVTAQFMYSTVATAGFAQGNGTGIGVQIGGPEMGRCWSIRNAVVGGGTIAQTPTGTAFLLVSPQPPLDLSITSVLDIANPLPARAFYSAREAFVGPNDNVWLYVAGGTNNQLYTVRLIVQDEPYLPTGAEVSV